MVRGNRTTWQKELGTCSEKKRGRLIIRPRYKFGWLRGGDLNHRPLGYEPNELPDCSTPQSHPTSTGLCRSNPPCDARRVRWYYPCKMDSHNVDLKQTINLPRTDFSMKANLAQAEPKLL